MEAKSPFGLKRGQALRNGRFRLAKRPVLQRGTVRFSARNGPYRRVKRPISQGETHRSATPFRASAYCLCFSKSRISVSSSTSFDGEGGVAGAASLAFPLRAILLMPLTRRNTQKAMMTKSNVVCRKLP